MREKELAAFLRQYHGRPLRLMEVCGTHTSALYRTGLRQLLPERITLVSGPGCPVCVTPTSYIDKLVDYAFMPDHQVLAFGDMLAVPGSRMSLADARGQGGAVDFFYAPEEALEKAKAHPEVKFVLAAVGFETTAPVWATVIQNAKAQKLKNIKFLTSLKTMPEALRFLCRKGQIDGFLCPGHVAVITGSCPFAELADEFGETMVIGGFSQSLLLRAMTRLVLESSRNRAGMWNEYPAVVKEEGNQAARQIIGKVFEEGPATWRGIGILKGSGLYLNETYREFDAGSRGLDTDAIPAGCLCSKIVLGQALPGQCPHFGKRCTPEHPVGACMVSSEGTCCITFREG
ncbi:MAG: hydrogenase formation protein HypD [Acidaminococcaceae bacterium]|nr:hydrogenase formation protein HypD [Acidaminococcaceae bacterium]